MTLENLLSQMWTDYCHLNPAALRIHSLITQRGEIVQNDHIALRTFNHPQLGIKSLESQFLKFGYVEKGQYTFVEKKLFAKHYEHPLPGTPKVFISEIQIEKLSEKAQSIIHNLVSQIQLNVRSRVDFSMMGRPWNLSFATYQELAQESEYASWVAAHGFRPNHFTVSINGLNSFHESIHELNQFLKNQGFKLNTSGGEIKGSPKEFLEQSSTMASKVKVHFQDGTFDIPGCYFEFAKRYRKPGGQLYQGFIEKSANKIFESTDSK